MKSVGDVLGISEKAVEFWRLTNFLFPSEEEKIDLMIRMKDRSRREIDNYINVTRQKKLKDNQYSNVEEFLELFGKSKKMALERLFQQPLNSGMLSLFNGDPVHLFRMHSNCEPEVWYMDIMI
ncbi:hypothetical protein, partial [Paenibacillus sp. GCM10012306]|uniref:hypothetical protein n=1 Tax=Paenibacillus sp. GCM10012306 TaxID=3317342 RepID=UPI00360E85C6